MNKIKRYLNLLRELSWFDFKLKYYTSMLGLFWSFLKPLLMLLILYVVFNYFLKTGIANFQIYLLLGIVMWNFFADSTKDSMTAMVAKTPILQKTNISPVIVVISTIFHSFWTFIINLIIFFIFFFAFGLKIHLSILIFPLLVFFFILLILGVSFFITLLYMRFKDFFHIWDVFLQLLFWMTPIVYRYNMVPENYLRWYFLNPVARIIIDTQNVILYAFFPQLKQLLISGIIVMVIFIAGLLVFKKYARLLVDQL